MFIYRKTKESPVGNTNNKYMKPSNSESFFKPNEEDFKFVAATNFKNVERKMETIHENTNNFPTTSEVHN